MRPIGKARMVGGSQLMQIQKGKKRATKSKRISERELRLTAAVYARHVGVAEHIRRTGSLPKRIGGPWSVIAMKVVMKERGTDFELTPDEHVIYEAIVRERRLPGGSVVLIDRCSSKNFFRTRVIFTRSSILRTKN
jgi:hypothetical protein